MQQHLKDIESELKSIKENYSEARAPKWGSLPPRQHETPEEIIKEWERLKPEWLNQKKMRPRIFVPFYEKMKQLQKK